MITHPGVYCLRTNGWDEETLWRTYTSLDVAVFRSLKSELSSTAPRGAPTAICSSP